LTALEVLLPLDLRDRAHQAHHFQEAQEAREAHEAHEVDGRTVVLVHASGEVDHHSVHGIGGHRLPRVNRLPRS
jgi:hypothetical protein